MRSVSIVVHPGFAPMTFAAVNVFHLANAELDCASYEISLLSASGGLVQASAGFEVATEIFDEQRRDTIIVAGGVDIAWSSPGILDFLRASPDRSRRISGVCTGAFLLARAGLLDGRRATTHWAFAHTLRRDFPAVQVDEDRIFVKDGPIWTSAGMTAGIDLALAMVEEDHGLHVARMTARKLVVYHRRSGGQSQHSVLLDLDVRSDRIQKVLDFAKRNLHLDLSVPALAEVAHLSPRQFSRTFIAETGRPPAKAIESLRVEAARAMMDDGHHPIETVARETGFGDGDRMRRAFIRVLGQTPQMVRRNG